LSHKLGAGNNVHLRTSTLLSLLRPNNRQQRHYAFGRPSVRPLKTISREAMCLYLVEISMKLETIYHVRGHCWKGFRGQRSEVKVTARPSSLFRRRHTYSSVWRRGSRVFATSYAGILDGNI